MKFRYGHSCARIHTDGTGLQFSIIVAGGSTNVVEMLDQGATSWHKGPQFPFAIDYAAMVEDPLGK